MYSAQAAPQQMAMAASLQSLLGSTFAAPQVVQDPQQQAAAAVLQALLPPGSASPFYPQVVQAPQTPQAAAVAAIQALVPMALNVQTPQQQAVSFLQSLLPMASPFAMQPSISTQPNLSAYLSQLGGVGHQLLATSQPPLGQQPNVGLFGAPGKMRCGNLCICCERPI